MDLFSAIRLAFRALGRHRLRSVLTLLGITIGVAVVIVMVAIGTGAQRSIEQRVRAAGANLVTVVAGNYSPGDLDPSSGDVIDPGNLAGLQPRLRVTGDAQSAPNQINLSAFSVPGINDKGPYSRLYLRNPGIQNHDLSVFKNFPLGASGKRTIQLRLEAFNVLNHPQFSAVNRTTNVTNAAGQTGADHSFRQLSNAILGCAEPGDGVLVLLGQERAKDGIVGHEPIDPPARIGYIERKHDLVRQYCASTYRCDQ